MSGKGSLNALKEERTSGRGEELAKKGKRRGGGD